MRAFSVHFDREMSIALRSQHPLSILVIDLDDFKRVNDTFGHISGDRVLLHLAQVIRRQLRDNDVVARYAGDEFVALLPMTDYEQQAMSLIESRARSANSFYERLMESSEMSASIGAATIPPDGQKLRMS